MKTYSILPAALLAAWLSASAPAVFVQDTEPEQAAAVADDATGEAAAEALLEQIEQAAAELTTLRARIRYTRVQGLLGDEQQRFGDFYYLAPAPGSGEGGNEGAEGESAPGPARFAVHLDGLVMDDRLRTIDQWYIYDGRWLLERNHDDQTATRRELRPADAEPDDTLALDSQSVPIPLHLKKDEVLAEYTAIRAEDDTIGEWTLHHLVLTPRRPAQPGGEAGDGPEPLHLWFDSETLLLTKVVTRDGDDEIELLFAPTEMQPNAEIDPETFDTALPDAAEGWEVQEVPLG